MKTGKCYIVGAGENYGLDFKAESDDYIIGADGGFSYLKQQALRTDLVIGDFDTLQQDPTHPNIIRLSREKDDTDTLAAIREGIKKGYENFYIYCGTGGRLDHTIANIQSVAYLSENGMNGFLIDKDNVVTAVTNGQICFDKCCSGYISVFSHSQKSEGVTINDLKYPLNEAILSNTFPIGVSNEFVGCESSIAVRNGTLLIIFPRSAISGVLNIL